MNKQASSQSGFTMIEMLVALVILSVGLLGVAALQTRGQQFNYEAYVHTQATFLAYDLTDRMRNNPIQAQGGQYAATGNPNSEADCSPGPCSPAQLTGYDLSAWFNSVEQTLPGGEATISHDTTTGVYTIVIKWQGEMLEDGESEVKQQSWGVRI